MIAFPFYKRWLRSTRFTICLQISISPCLTFADEGLTGTRMDKREDFKRMMADCRKGKIDKVMVKSISRFARNTRDCLAALRELSRLGVSVQFEKENIDTRTLTTELMVSVSGSLAQQESMG